MRPTHLRPHRISWIAAAILIAVSGATAEGAVAARGSAAGGALAPSVLDVRPDETIELPVAGRAGVPADADAVVLNLTATRAVSPGFATVWPCGTTPPDTSNLNYRPGTDTANLAIVPLAANGSVCLDVSAPTDLVVDVLGHFPADTTYTPTTATRLLDTRPDGLPSPEEHAHLLALPWARAAATHVTPEGAVEAFVDFVGADDMVVGEFRQQDLRSGEVEIRPSEPAFAAASAGMIRPATAVRVQQSGPSGSWWVSGALAENAVVHEPLPNATIGSPLTIAGTTLTIGDPVELWIFVDGQHEPLHRALLTGSGVFAMGDFAVDALVWPAPPGGTGTLMVVTSHGVTTVPVAFAG